MTRWDAERTLTDAGFHVYDGPADVVVAKHESRGVWFSMKHVDSKWKAYLDPKDGGKAIAMLPDANNASLAFMLRAELEKMTS